ncbi:hypothetical protein DID76_04445 [Candidatus Marinamargulisbacteria bacterium SCGC AG-414-C22]|nr:hypothetical protein DID76_04445 [Candidatus Marinamargulisbacteria bacterium SCGC AG-414-C22]
MRKFITVLFFCLILPGFVLAQGTTVPVNNEIMGIMNDKVISDIEKEIKHSVQKQAIYSYNIANISTPGFEPILFPEDKEELGLIVPEDSEYFRKVLLEHMTTNMARNRNKHNAYLLLYKKKFEIYRQVATLGKK